MKEFQIGKNEADQRLDKYLKKRMKALPTSMLYKFLRKKNITLNGKKADGSEHIEQGDVVRIFVSDETFAKFSATDEPAPNEVISPSKRKSGKQPKIKVLYQDENILLLNKPAGILSQKARPEDYSVVDFILEYVRDNNILSKEESETFHPGITSRLDRNTSGLLSAGISLKGLQELNAHIKNHDFDKYYLAIVKGKMEKEHALLSAYHHKNSSDNTVSISDKNGGEEKEIQTEYTVLDYNNGISLLKVKLITGQTHQIRAHLANIGHPLAGDQKYGEEAWNKELRERYGIRRQMLHSYELHFPDIKSGALANLSGKTVTCPPEQDMKKAIDMIFKEK